MTAARSKMHRPLETKKKFFLIILEKKIILNTIKTFTSYLKRSVKLFEQVGMWRKIQVSKFLYSSKKNFEFLQVV